VYLAQHAQPMQKTIIERVIRGA